MKITETTSDKLSEPVIPISETLTAGIVLAVAGGYLDAYTYLMRGGVFSNAQTGNIVLMGMSIADGNYMGIISYFIPVLAFFLGIIIAEFVRKHFGRLGIIHWKHIILIFEILIILSSIMIPSTSRGNIAANILISFVCSLQVQSFRKLEGNIYSTTMCTGNLRSAAAHIYNYKDTHDRTYLKKAVDYILIIIAFAAGAAFGCIFCRILGITSVIIDCILLFMVFLLLFSAPEGRARTK